MDGQAQVPHHHGHRGQSAQRRAAQACAHLVVYWVAGPAGAANPLRQPSIGVARGKSAVEMTDTTALVTTLQVVHTAVMAGEQDTQIES